MGPQDFVGSSSRVIIGYPTPSCKIRNFPHGALKEWAVKLFYDTGERQIPLYLRLDTRAYWPEIQSALGLPKKENAAVAVAVYENFLTGCATSYSRRNERKADCNGLLSVRNVTRCIDYLGQAGLVENMVQVEGGRGWQSAARGSEALAEIMRPLIPNLGGIPITRPNRAAIIRDATGREIEPTRKYEFERIERAMWPINEMLAGTEIRNGKGFDIRYPMRRVFNLNTDHGGRLFTMGGIGWQNVPSDERHDITINGESTVELDFKAIHPHILYSKRGHPVPKDCYDVKGWPRDLVKLALLVLINADNLTDVVTVLANSDGERIVRDESGGVIEVTTEKRLMKQVAGGDYSKAMAFAHSLVKDVKERHHLIQEDFHTGAALWLMNKDAAIAMNVMQAMMKIDEPVLAVHDSFRVRAGMKEKLEEIMFEAAEKAGLFGIEITAKTRH